MVKRKDPFWEHAVEMENSRFMCKFCHDCFSGGISRIKSHLSGLSGRDIQLCPKVPEAIQLKAKQALQPIDPPTKRAKNVAASNNFLEGEIVSGSSSSHMPNQCKLDKQFAMFLFSDRICVDAISSLIFKNFLNGVAEHGPGYELPSSFTVKSRVIPDIKKEVEEYMENVMKKSIKTGYTLMCRISFYSNCSFLGGEDAHVTDIFAYTPKGMVCMNPPFYSDFEETMSYIMMFFGHANAVQFIIDNDDCNTEKYGSSIKDFLTKEYPGIYQTPCATHGIRLLLRKIADVPFVHNTLTVAKWIVEYIFRCKVDVSLRRVHKMKSNVASYFFSLISLLEVESELQAVQVPIVTLFSDWEKLGDDRREAFEVAKFINLAIHCKEFWSRGKMVAQVMKPLYQVLDLVHCDGPTFGYLYEMMERVQDAIRQCCRSNQVLYEDIWKILNEVRSDIIHPIHAAAAFLNPIYMCSEKFEENNEMIDGVKNIMQILVGSEEEEAFKSQVQFYRIKDSNLFTDQAMMMLKSSHPRVWWESCGNNLPVLQKYAIQILSQPCSSTLCKRHKLRDNYSADSAFMLNTMMMERYKSLETQMREPIILDKLGVLHDDPKFQDLWNEENELDVDNDRLFINPFFRMAEDPTGSWLDWWPMKRNEL
ncbi:uncharacterized protein LOC133880065 [Alnus glutinosa]|uniref:uncharacterized protein LOC133880065 n=1 Tax=Alnus glutinosa TaxID=3517 RepID=UPI002D790E19|nr:uncharacterized protein LOC133880065 [Alnus glutinosa]